MNILKQSLSVCLAIAMAATLLLTPAVKADVSGVCQITNITSNGCANGKCAVHVSGVASPRPSTGYHWRNVSTIFVWDNTGGWVACGFGSLVDNGTTIFNFEDFSGSVAFTQGLTYTFQARCDILNTAGATVFTARSGSRTFQIPGS